MSLCCVLNLIQVNSLQRTNTARSETELLSTTPPPPTNGKRAANNPALFSPSACLPFKEQRVNGLASASSHSARGGASGGGRPPDSLTRVSQQKNIETETVRTKIKQGWLSKKKGSRGNKWELKYVQVNEEHIEYYSARIKVCVARTKVYVVFLCNLFFPREFHSDEEGGYHDAVTV